MTTHARRILVAVDFTEQSDRAMRTALSMAAAFGGTELHVVFVKNAIEGMPVSGRDVEKMDADMDKVKTYSAELAAKFREEHPEFEVPEPIAHRMIGAPANMILRLAGGLEVGLIVVGTRDRRGIARAVLGSVAAQVVEKAGCPVLVVRPTDHKDIEPMPDVLPLCPECADIRHRTAGAEQWCERHSERHSRIPGYSYAGASNAPVRPWGF